MEQRQRTIEANRRRVLAERTAQIALTMENRTRITDWIVERAGQLYRRRFAPIDGATAKAMSLAVDEACREFQNGAGPF